MDSLASRPETTAERRHEEATLLSPALAESFPMLNHYPEGKSRTIATLKLIERDYYSNPGIRMILTGKMSRQITSTLDDSPATPGGFPILAAPARSAIGNRPDPDSTTLFRRYIDGLPVNPEDIKSLLHAICREVKLAGDLRNPALEKLNDLAVIGIYNLQQQRKKEIDQQ